MMSFNCHLVNYRNHYSSTWSSLGSSFFSFHCLFKGLLVVASLTLVSSSVVISSSIVPNHHREDSAFQASSSSWNYAYHFNWHQDDPKGHPKVSRYAETSNSKQYIDPPFQIGQDAHQSKVINSRSYRHVQPEGQQKSSFPFNGQPHQPHANHDSSAFIENIRKEIMSSFKESLPDKSGHFNFHHPPPDYHHLASHPRENIFDRSGGPFPRDLHLQAPFPPPGPPIPSSILMSPHESGSSYGKPDGNLKRSQRSHGTHHEPEIGQTSKSNSWNFNTNQGFYYRVHNVDGKKHEERGSYGDGHQSGPWVDQGRSLVREINPINGFDSHPNGPFPDNFIFPSQHQHQHPHPHQQHHHHQHQHPPHQDQHAPVWFQPGFNNNNFNQQHHEPRHNNNGPGLNNRNHFEPNNNHQNQQHHPSPPPHEIRNNHRPNNF